MSRPCPIDTCERPAPGGQPVCGACRADLERALRAVPDLTRELDLTLSKQTSKTPGGRSAEIPLAFGEGASNASALLHNTLCKWVCELNRAETAIWPANAPAAMAGWLSGSLSRLLGHPGVIEAHEEITGAVRDAQRIIDRPPGYVYAGPCTACSTAMYVKPGAAYARCPILTCREYHDVADRREWMIAQCENLLGSSAYVAMVCRGLGVQISESTVRMWVKRRKLQPRTWTDPRGNEAIREQRKRPLYRVGDVIDVALGNVQKFTA
ncbi:hypothetical protein [Actinomadura montaniterrae]|uniref:Uncharacterized protein n=1 Tax=Actinomadura montaniterrae TaxID=1803903 RepID=A0A6L3W0G8_9ACTN|nr:hypothetical protein [Actinomadura montaniterrae]KAB2384739.1 hypothetical protein F9B16_09840 [Actinomadura montaniterrae]